MTAVRRLFRALGLLALLPALVLAGALLASVLLRPSFQPVDMGSPPRFMAVLGVLRDADGRMASCRAFYWVDIADRLDALPEMRFDPTPSELRDCGEALRAFSEARAWPETFEWERPGRAFAFVEADDPTDPGRLTLTYPPSPDRTDATRYAVDRESGRPGDFEYRESTSSGWGVGVLGAGLLAGLVTWLVIVARIVLRRRTR